MKDNDIWYSSTVGYEGLGPGSNTNELFNAIQKLLKNYAPTGSTPGMMVGNKNVSFNVDTELTRIEQTFAVRIKESMVTALNNALAAFIKENPLTKDSNTYKVFSQGTVPSVTSPLSYFTQSSAIAEAKRELTGKMAQIYTVQGQPYITALGANQAELQRISSNNFSSIIPSAVSMQNQYNDILRQQQVAKENAELVSRAESNRETSLAAKVKYENDQSTARRLERNRRLAEEKAAADKAESERQAAIDRARVTTSKQEDIVRLRDSALYQKFYGSKAREDYETSEHTRRQHIYDYDQLMKRTLGEVPPLYTADNIDIKYEALAAKLNRPRGRMLKEAYHAARSAERKRNRDMWLQNDIDSEVYDNMNDDMSPLIRSAYEQWYNDYYGGGIASNAISISNAVEAENKSAISRKRRRKEGGKDLDIFGNEEEDTRTKREKHLDNLRIFSKTAAGIFMIVSIASKILDVVGNIFKAAVQAGGEALTNKYTSMKLNMDPYTLHKYSNLAIEKGLDKHIFTNAFTSVGTMLGDPLAESNYDIFKNSGFAVVMGGDPDNISDLIRNSFEGKSAEEQTKIILDAYLKRYKKGLLLNGDTGDPEAVAKQLSNSLGSISPELADIFVAAISSGAGSLEEFMKSSKKGNTGFIDIDQTKLTQLGEISKKFEAFWDETKLKIFSNLADTITKLIENIEGFVKKFNKETKYTNTVAAFLENKRTRDAANMAIGNVTENSLASIAEQGIPINGEVLTNVDAIRKAFTKNGVFDIGSFSEFLSSTSDPKLLYASKLINQLSKVRNKAIDLMDSNSLVAHSFSIENISDDAYSDFATSYGNFDLQSGIYPELDLKYGGIASRFAFSKDRGKPGTPEWYQNNQNAYNRAIARKANYDYTKDWSADRVSTAATSNNADRRSLISEARKRYNKIAGKSPTDLQVNADLKDLADFMLSFSLTSEEVLGNSAMPGNLSKSALDSYLGLMQQAEAVDKTIKAQNLVEYGVIGVVPAMGPDAATNEKLLDMSAYEFIDNKSREEWLKTGINMSNSFNLKVDIDGKEAYNSSVELGSGSNSAMLDEYSKNNEYYTHVTGSVNSFELV